MAMNIHLNTTPTKPNTFLTSLLLLLFILFLSFHFLHHHYYYSSLLTAPAAPNPPVPFRLFHNHFLRLSSSSSSSNSSISSLLLSLTSSPHISGTPSSLSTLSFVLRRLSALGLKTHVAEFQPLLSFPLYRHLSLTFPNKTHVSLPLDVTDPNTIPPYHAYSPPGSVSGPVVFANYGRKGDYEKLRELGVNVSGCVVLCRNGGVYRGKVVKRAFREGAVGVLLFNGRERYGEEGRKREDWYPADGIERGTVMDGPGDPLTPGWAAVEGAERLGVDDEVVRRKFPAITSMPVSFENAARILRSLEGPEMPENWRDWGLREENGGGVGKGPVIVNLTYLENQTITTIGDVFAVIPGAIEPDRFILLGNHRDAWTYGAVDPNSGTAVLLDIARRFSILLDKGWRPRRTIVLCSWDAEEFGMIGSTEWVEQNLQMLGSKAVAYLNVDCAVQGPGLFAGATPQLDPLIVEITKLVKDPYSDGRTVYEAWSASNGGVKIDRLSGVASDFAPFLQHAGIPAIDLFYGKDYPVYHTAYDTYSWMEKFGDPLFQRHVAVSELWGLLALRLADEPILPFDYVSYSIQLKEYAALLKEMLSGDNIYLQPLNAAIDELSQAAFEVAKDTKELQRSASDVNVMMLELRRKSLNDRLMLAERGFLDPDGLLDRRWFKHLIYGPPGDSESKYDFFPGVMDAVMQAESTNDGDGVALINHEIWRVARAIQRVASTLRGELS